tara:strand:+ start:18 stop:482 length:465 start_codon:yes stop_codon:yes gene_type:complete
MDITTLEPVLMITLLYGVLCGTSIILVDKNISIENIMVYGPLYYFCALSFNYVINSQYIHAYNNKCELSAFTLIINTTAVTTLILGVFMYMVFIMKWYIYFNTFFKDNGNIKDNILKMKTITIWFFFTAIITSLISLNVSLSQQCVSTYEEDDE